MKGKNCIILLLLVLLSLALVACNGKTDGKLMFMVDNNVYAISGTAEPNVPTNPTKTGYTFVGWYLDEDCRTPYEGTLPDGNMVYLYAGWALAGSLDEVRLVGFEQSSGTYLCDVDNEVTTLDFASVVTLPYGFSLTVTAQEDSAITGTVARLQVGDNRYTVTVHGETDSRDYRVCIHRNYLYVVTFDAAGGSDVSSIPVQENHLLPEPTTQRTGYTLLGWGYDFTRPVTADMTLTAVWQANTYTLTYDQSDLEPRSITYDQPFTLADPTRTGYKLEGWYWQNNKLEGETWRWAHDVTVTARWTAIQYPLTYTLDGGEATLPTTYTIESTLTLATPTRTAYRFLGWSLDDAQPTLTATITAGTTGPRHYTARWQYDGHDILYVLNGGENDPANPTKVGVDLGTVTLAPATRTGYAFAGWYNAPDFPADGLMTTVSADSTALTLYARFTPITYTFRFLPGNDQARGSMEDQQFTYDVPLALRRCDFVLDGYHMQWQDAKGKVYRDGEAVTNATTKQGEVLILTACWTPNTYALTLSNNSEQTPDTTIQVTFDAAMPTIDTPTKRGYTFDGYYLGDVCCYDADLTCAYATWRYTKDVTYTAHWTPNTYTITLSSNEGTGGRDGVVATFGQPLPALEDADAPSREGYIFAGYFADTAGLGTKYYDAHLVAAVWDIDDDTTLYACWSSGSNHISFVQQGGAGTQEALTALFDQAMPALTLVPERVGYHFAGYYDRATGGTCYYNADRTSARSWDRIQDTQLYAQWTPIRYIIRYRSEQEVQGEMADQYVDYNAKVPLSPNSLVRTGYLFDGWQCVIATVPETFADQAPVQNLSEQEGEVIVMTAMWRTMVFAVTLDDYICTDYTTYTLTFRLNGGDGEAPAAQSIDGQTSMVYPAIPTRAGYVFRGWCTTPTGEALFDFSRPLKADTTVWADWYPTTQSDCAQHNILDVTAHGFATPLSVDTAGTSETAAKGYYFAALRTGTMRLHLKNSTTSDGAQIAVRLLDLSNQATMLDTTVNRTSYTDISIAVTKGNVYCLVCHRVSVVYTPTLTLYFDGDLDAPQGGISGTYVRYNYTEQIAYDALYTLPVPAVEEGYAFDGWMDAKGVRYTDANGDALHTWQDLKDVTLYAHSEPLSYTLTFVVNGGSAVDPLVAPYRSDIRPPKTSREDYSLVGWYTDNQFTHPFYFAEMPLGGGTLYARWTPYTLVLLSDDEQLIGVSAQADLYAAQTYGIYAQDTDGDTLPVAVELIAGDGHAGSTVSIRLTAQGKYGHTATGELLDIAVYGTPNLAVGNPRTYIKATDTLSTTMFRVTARDSFDKSLTPVITTQPATYKKGDTIAVTFTVTDSIGNVAVRTIEGVRVYGNPAITLDRTKRAVSTKDALNAALFSAAATDSFGQALNVTVTTVGGSFAAGSQLSLQFSATDIAGNKGTLPFTAKVYGTPTLSAPVKTDFALGEVIDLAALGIAATDSFGETLTATINLQSGVYEAGSTQVYRVSATDAAGNTVEQDITVTIF